MSLSNFNSLSSHSLGNDNVSASVLAFRSYNRFHKQNWYGYRTLLSITFVKNHKMGRFRKRILVYEMLNHFIIILDIILRLIILCFTRIPIRNFHREMSLENLALVLNYNSPQSLNVITSAVALHSTAANIIALVIVSILVVYKVRNQYHYRQI